MIVVGRGVDHGGKINAMDKEINVLQTNNEVKCAHKIVRYCISNAHSKRFADNFVGNHVGGNTRVTLKTYFWV